MSSNDYSPTQVHDPSIKRVKLDFARNNYVYGDVRIGIFMHRERRKMREAELS